MKEVSCICGYTCFTKHMSRHIAACKVVKYAEQNNIDQLHKQINDLNKIIQTIQSADHDSLIQEIALLTQKVEDKDEQIKTAHRQMAEKDEEIKKLTSALVAEPKVVNNNNYFDINVKAIGEVSLKHITDIEKTEALRLDIVDSIPAIVEKIFWGDEPRNACIKIPNKRCREWVVQTRVDGEKRACHVDKDEVIDIAMGHSRRVLKDHAYKNESNRRNLRFLDHDDEMTKSWNSDKKLFKEQRKRTEMKVLDNCTK